MARKFRVEGTKTYLYWSLGLLVLGLWSVKDGWFPSAGVMQAHPPGDHFYAFNKSLAILSLTASAICGFIHKIVR